MQPKIQDTLTLERMEFTDRSTIGELRADGELICFTLEDTCRINKIPGKTAIPSGKYQMVISESKRFRKLTPELLNVPNYEGIRIHSGNTPDQTDGCVLVGLRKGKDVIFDSKKAYDIVFSEVEKRLVKGPLFISVVGGTTPIKEA